MAPTAGYLTTLYVSGTPTTITNQGTTELVAGPPQSFRISDPTKRVLDPATAVVIKDQDSTVVTSDFTIDYLTGIVTSATGGYASVTISGKYLPLLPVAEGRSTSASPSRAELDTSIFGEAFTKAILGKKSASGDIVTLAQLDQDLDAGGGTRTWAAVFTGATEVLLDVRVTPTSTLRAWVLTPTNAVKSDQAGLVESTITWRNIDKRATDGTECGFSVFNPT